MIKIKNDKKEKPQSWEASEDNDGGGSEGYYNYSINGYGKDEEECRKNFMKEIDNLIQALEEVKSENNKALCKDSPMEVYQRKCWAKAEEESLGRMGIMFSKESENKVCIKKDETKVKLAKSIEKTNKEIAEHDNERLNRVVSCGSPRDTSLKTAKAFLISVDTGEGHSHSTSTLVDRDAIEGDESKEQNQLNNDKDMSKELNKVTGVEENVLKFKETTKRMNDLYEAKNKDYGDSFNKTLHEFGLVASAVKLGDKIRRFKNLMKADAKVKDESIEDTLIDIANYSVMTLLFLNEKESHELEGKI